MGEALFRDDIACVIEETSEGFDCDLIKPTHKIAGHFVSKSGQKEDVMVMDPSDGMKEHFDRLIKHWDYLPMGPAGFGGLNNMGKAIFQAMNRDTFGHVWDSKDTL